MAKATIIVIGNRPAQRIRAEQLDYCGETDGRGYDKLRGHIESTLWRVRLQQAKQFSAVLDESGAWFDANIWPQSALQAIVAQAKDSGRKLTAFRVKL